MKKGIVLSLDRMNRILEIHPRDFVAVVQPGVITGELQEAARAMNLLYPPDPASLKDCSIGGNIATNAGGPRCLKYGVTRSYILGLEKQVERLKADNDLGAARLIQEEIDKSRYDPQYFPQLMLGSDAPADAPTRP